MIYRDNPIPVALTAYGMSGSVFHAPLITAHAGFTLKKVLERSGRQRSKERYPDVLAVKDFDLILKDDAIELVIINTPEHTHYALAREALLAGKHVVVEKAFTTTSREGEALITLAEGQDKLLSVFQNSRWHGDFMTIRKLLDNRMLGQLVEYEAHYDRYRNFIRAATWKEETLPGTGVLYNLGSHMIDQALVLFGWPHSVAADIRIQRRGGKVDDNFELVLHYDDLKVTLKSSSLVREPGPRFVLHGTEGSFVKYGNDPQEALLRAGRFPLEEGWGSEPETQWGKLNTQLKALHFEGKVETVRGNYLDFYQNIYDVIRKDKELIVKPEQALQTIKIIEAGHKSNDERRMIYLDSE